MSEHTGVGTPSQDYLAFDAAMTARDPKWYEATPAAIGYKAWCASRDVGNTQQGEPMREKTGKRLYAAFLVVCAGILAFLLVSVWDAESECSAKGGEWLRGILSKYHCYDAASLRRLQ